MSLNNEIARWWGEDRPYSEPLISSVKGKKLCPSFQKDLGATGFATQMEDGTFQFFESERDCELSSQSQSTRYFGSCVTSRCFYWSGNCQLGTKISHIAISEVGVGNVVKVIGECPIQKTCRWRSENGTSACKSCTQVEYEVKYG